MQNEIAIRKFDKYLAKNNLHETNSPKKILARPNKTE